MLRIKGTATLDRIPNTKKDPSFKEGVNLTYITKGSWRNTAARLLERNWIMAKVIKPYRNKGTCLETTPNDLQAICELAIDSLQRHGGRVAKYADTAEDRERFLSDCVSYFQRLTEGNKDRETEEMLLPSIESLCLYLSISRTTLFAYSHRSEEWKEIIDTVRNAIASAKMQLACRGKIPSIVAVFDLCNNYSYHNTSEFHLSTEPPQDTADTPRLSTEQIKRLASPEPPQIPEE